MMGIHAAVLNADTISENESMYNRYDFTLAQLPCQI